MEVAHFESLRLAYWTTFTLLNFCLLMSWWSGRPANGRPEQPGGVALTPLDIVFVSGLALLGGLTYIFGTAGPGAGQLPVLTPAQVAGSAVVQIQYAILLLVYLRVMRGVSPSQFLGLRAGSMKAVIGWSFGSLAITALVMYLAMVVWWHGVLGLAPPDDSDQVVVQVFLQSNDRTLRLAIIIAAALVAPLTEELTYRGLIYGFSYRFMGHWPAALLSSALFSLVHADAVASLPLFVLALGLATAYHRSRSLWVPILMHMLFNSWNLAAMLMQ